MNTDICAQCRSNDDLLEHDNRSDEASGGVSDLAIAHACDRVFANLDGVFKVHGTLKLPN